MREWGGVTLPDDRGDRTSSDETEAAGPTHRPRKDQSSDTSEGVTSCVVVLSVGEVRTVLGRLDGAPLQIASLLYGAGLRTLPRGTKINRESRRRR